MEIQTSIKNDTGNMSRAKTQHNISRKRSARALIHLLYVFMWVLGSCSLLENPIDDSIETPTPTAMAKVAATAVTPTAAEPSPTFTTPSSTSTSPPAVEANPTPTQSNAIPPNGVDQVENPRFGLLAGTPLGMANIARTEEGCNWLGIGGQVLDREGMPVLYLVVEVGGTMGEAHIFELALTGSEVVFGPGGFVVKVADRPIESDGTLWVQVFDLAGVPQTRKIYLTSYSDCARNLILVNFSELHGLTGTTIYFPTINLEP